MTALERRGGWIQTYTGRQFWPLDPQPEDICIEDIAHGLANTARYGGHTRSYYSVAQHSALVSLVCEPEDAMWGLLHDAAEAYLGDMPRPIKHGPGMEEFRRAEHKVMCAVTQAFGLTEWEPESVKKADAALLATEKRDLLRRMQTDMSESEWLHGASAENALDFHIKAMTPADAEQFYLTHFGLVKHNLRPPGRLT